MVTTTSPFRQASNRKIPALLLLLAVLAGCQTRQAATPSTRTPGAQKTAFLGPGAKPSVAEPPIPAPKPLQPWEPARTRGIADQSPRKAARQETRLSADLPDELSDWRVTRVSNQQWRVTPKRRVRMSDSPPSLMEDAIITSSIHARLQAATGIRPAAWKYSSRGGNVLLSTPELTVRQATAALSALVEINKVAEIRLTTNLR